MRLFCMFAFLAVACAAPAPVLPAVEVPAMEAVPTCQVRGPIDLPLLAPSGFSYGRAAGAEGTWVLEGGPRPRIRTWLESQGWRLESNHAPGARDGDAFLARDVALDEVVNLRRGARVQIESMEGQRLIARPAEFELSRANVRLAVAARAELACDALSADYRAPEGADEEGESVFFERTSPLEFAATPGGPAVATVEAERPNMLGQLTSARLLRREGTFARIAYESGALRLSGWIAADRVVDRAVGGLGALGILGPGDETTVRVCQSAQALDLFVSRGERPELVGRLAPSARFVPGEGSPTTLPISPPPGSRVRAESGVRFMVRTPGDLRCAEETYPRELSFDLEVRSFEGAGLALEPGGRCRASVSMRGTFLGYGCRAEITCGEHALFGDASHNGYFSCEFGGSRVVGEDTQMSEDSSGDPAMRFDTDAGVVRLQDGEHGRFGPFTLDARIL